MPDALKLAETSAQSLKSLTASEVARIEQRLRDRVFERSQSSADLPRNVEEKARIYGSVQPRK